MHTRNLASAEVATPIEMRRPGLQELAEGCLRRNPYLALKNVSCDCRDGVLVLRGCLPSYYLKQIAQETVARLAGVRAIDNQIEVVPPASQARPG
jgi:osmotically-inducible protein OsmY